MTTIPDGAGVRFCWCPPMQDPDDPSQHEAACAHAAFVEQWQARQAVDPIALRRDLWGPNRRPAPTAIPSRCYEASFGWVHVKPGCHCAR